jgi:prepilin-type N-terminal cleavage/methylation domain-containing protein
MPDVCQHSRSLNAQRGFTLAELIVASTLITIIMTAVYTTFSSTLRVQRLGEDHLHTYQDARTALSVLQRELNCIVGGTEYLFEGESDEFAFFSVTPPLNTENGKGPQVLWIKYRYSRSDNVLVREEAVVEDALPIRREGEEELDRERVKLGRKRKFDFATGVLGFDVWYYWVPKPPDRPFGTPPIQVEPIVLEENRQGWGLPQGMKVAMTLEDPNSTTGEATFLATVTFHGPTWTYDEKRLGMGGVR